VGKDPGCTATTLFFRGGFLQVAQALFTCVEYR
jgi:hypothetical protein